MTNAIARYVDRAEQLIALVLYVFLVRRIWPEEFSFANAAAAAILLSEGLIILFLIIRRPTAQISARWQDWLLAAVGTAAPLLIVPTHPPAFPVVGLYFILFGMIVHISAKLSLNRSFGLVAANRGVKTAGGYRYVRHPMSLGYMVSQVGFLLMSPKLWNFVLYAVCWTALVLRIYAEERVLRDDAAYQSFSQKTRFRLLPGLF